MLKLRTRCLSGIAALICITFGCGHGLSSRPSAPLRTVLLAPATTAASAPPTVASAPPAALAEPVQEATRSSISWPGDESERHETGTMVRPENFAPDAAERLARFIVARARRGRRWSVWRVDTSVSGGCSSLTFERRPWPPGLGIRTGGPVVYTEPRLALQKQRLLYEGGFSFERSTDAVLRAVLTLGPPSGESFDPRRRAWIRGFTTRCGYRHWPVVAVTDDRIVLARQAEEEAAPWRRVDLFFTRGACEAALRPAARAMLAVRRQAIDCDERV